MSVAALALAAAALRKIQREHKDADKDSYEFSHAFVHGIAADEIEAEIARRKQ